MSRAPVKATLPQPAVGEQFRPEVTRRVQRKAGQWSHGGADHGNQNTDQQRGQRAARNAVAVVGQRRDQAHQNGGDHRFYRKARPTEMCALG